MALDSAVGALTSLFGEIVFYDAQDCYNYCIVFYDHIYEIMMNIVDDFPLAL